MAQSTSRTRPQLITSSFLISNLHCPSCVSHIEDTLFALDPRPSTVSPSLLTSWVTVQHDESLSLIDICDALENAGFDISDLTSESKDGHCIAGTSHTGSDGEIGYLDRLLHTFRPEEECASNGKLTTRHLQNCEACRLEALGKNGIDTKSPQPPSSSEKGKGKAAMESSDDEKVLPPLVTIDSEDSVQTWRASLAIGGMTCAVCVGTITEEMEKKPWVKKVTVNLISNSATIDFNGEEHKNDIVESIEDIGYDATIDTVVDLRKFEKVSSRNATTPRTVSIQIDGMFCEHCPTRVIKAVEGLGNGIKIEHSPDLKDPILGIIYTPQVPDFTIRTIMAAIAAADPAIEPVIYHPPTLEERSRKIHRKEQLRILIRVLLTFIIAIPTLIIGIIYMSLVSEHNSGKMFLMAPLRAGVSRAQWALFILATPVYFLCADVFHVRALKELVYMWKPRSTTPFLQRFYRFGSMNMLMSLGTTIAYISSLAQLIAAGVHPPSKPDNSTFYFDSVVFLTLFLLIGRLIESYSKSKTGDAVTMLGKLRPTEALLVEQGSFKTGEEIVNGSHESLRSVNVDLLEYGDIVKVLHGGSPPCDGILVQGETKFDESSLTGESRLVKKSIGDEVYSGTVNKESAVSIKITGVAGSSMLDQIVKAVREGQTRRAPMERIADTLTSYFVPVITLIAIGTWIFWLAMGTSGTLPRDYMDHDSGSWVVWALQFAISVFVVACPCGLALAAPTALFVGGGLAAQYGILVKGGGEAFEKASKLDCVVFDKTGTLTLGGEPVVTDSEVLPLDLKVGTDGMSEKVVLGMVSSIEGNSSHTLAKALVSFCRTKETTPINAMNVEEIAGKGMKGKFSSATNDEFALIIGNEALISDNSVTIPSSALASLSKWKSEGRSVALAAIKSSTSTYQLAAIFAISDPIRPEAPRIIAALQKRGTDVWMLSGDNQITANAIGSQVGIPSSNIIAGVLPSQKAEKIQYLQKSLKARNAAGQEHEQKRALVAMVGDGINDSPALTTADVGIAIGSGSDIAISSAEFVLVSSNLNTLLTLLDLSKVVFRRIKFNFGWALVYNMVMLPFAAGVLYPVVSGGKHVRLDPVWASLSMALSSISVVCSSLALRSKIPGIGFRVRKFEEGEGRSE
ncbi:related to CCC2-P-type ATPase involved in export of Cu++ from the cytosol into intracellular, secretory compartments [Phialocephala subalpina]|uniref:Related to CCC2-P-type ATPase involved in export of Cu++ from the cytosol into intracellular, secretory compartments n=1 Tax=Phialocephala subalpina TaxID=576137 RepID=A0A1L7XUP5_9HELO|nr:related to CCC2-P-type ATPase involved in export of Cu++ from the cytosol into intracellular, secretory compartments [Phialocephala subalpina]